MAKEVIAASKTLAGIPYSPAVVAGNFVFVSGQPGNRDDDSKEIKGIEAQTRQTLERMKQVLAAAGLSLTDVVKTTVSLVKVGDFVKMNQVYQEYFPAKR